MSWQTLKLFKDCWFEKEDTEAVWPEKVAKCLQKLPKKISLEKWKILTPLQKLSKNMGNLGKIILATGFEKLPEVQ